MPNTIQTGTEYRSTVRRTAFKLFFVNEQPWGGGVIVAGQPAIGNVPYKCLCVVSDEPWRCSLSGSVITREIY